MTQQGNAQSMSGRALALARRKAMSGAGKAGIGQAMAKTTDVATAPATPAAPVTRQAAPPRSPVSGANSGRAASLARRKAMSSRGKVAAVTKDRVRSAQGRRAVSDPAVSQATASEERSKGCGCGCKGEQREERAGGAVTTSGTAAAAARGSRAKVRPARRPEIANNPGRAASLARRRAQSARGKAGMGSSGMSAAQTARATNPQLSGRELAKVLRDQRSRRGGAGQKKSEPSGRQRPNRDRDVGAARDASWKVGAGETSHGQVVTGTMVGRSRSVTGDEPSTCRAVTGTEYMGADIFREFCQAEPAKGVRRAGVSATARGGRVTGNEVGRSTRVTGDEPGTCKHVTGTEYLGAGQIESFCETKPSAGPAKVTSAQTRGGKTVTGNNVGRSGRVTGDEVGAERVLTGTQYMQRDTTKDRVPAKVGASATLRGGAVTGTMVGRHKNMTGDEAGSCRNVTGDDYIGQEQFGTFCDATPQPQDRKVGLSATMSGERVTGTLTGRTNKVTGDEPGTCKAITGTPYAGAEQYAAFCEPEQTGKAAARMQHSRRMFGSVMTGIQPSVGGKATGDAKGACEPVTGTPYVGADQAAGACPATAADVGAPDFPQPLFNGEPWTQFSVGGPAHASEPPQRVSGVTGSGYEGGNITGPFGKAGGKVTGTEEARFGRRNSNVMTAPAADEPTMIDGRAKSRVTGEGISAGLKITGDDWDRGDRVTGTEGMSTLARNPSRRGPQVPMATAMAKGRPEGIPEPVSKVTGSSGNYEGGSLITFSGGARG